MTDSTQPFILIILGPQASGISSALNILDDLNIPQLINVPTQTLGNPSEFESTIHGLSSTSSDSTCNGLAMTLNFAELNQLNQDADTALAQIQCFKKHFPNVRTLFLSAPAEILSQRRNLAKKDYKSSTPEEELAFYNQLKVIKDYAIDTSTLSIEELRFKLCKILDIPETLDKMSVNLTSFGFKYGLPADAELVYDMRFIKNPFYIDSLRDQTGLDQPVVDYILDQAGVNAFFESWQQSICAALPMFLDEGKSNINIAIGCTGGKHRSVCMTMRLANVLKEQFPEYNISINHRERYRWPEQTIKKK